MKAIGLDFGTTNSALAIAKSDGMVRLAQFRDGATFRSIIYFEEHDSTNQAPCSRRARCDPKLSGSKNAGPFDSVDEVLPREPAIHTNADPWRDLRPRRSDHILLRHLRKSAEEQFGDLGSTLVVGRPVHLAVRETQLTTSSLSAGYASPSATPVSRTSTFYRSPSPPPTSTSSGSITKSSC